MSKKKIYIECCGLALLASLTLTSCHDAIDSDVTGRGGEGIRQGDMVLFAAGATTSNEASRAGGITTTPGQTYYMAKGYRFVCRMYYQPHADNNLYGVDDGTDATAWLMVDNNPAITNEGNSLYRRSLYQTPTTTDTYGFDTEATCFYWQNRKPHAFLAWTDLNKASTLTYSPVKYAGGLKFEPADEEYVKRTGENEDQWVTQGYEVYQSSGNTEYTSWDEVTNAATNTTTYPDGLSAEDFTRAEYVYENGRQCRYTTDAATAELVSGSTTERKYGWIQYQIFFDKLAYTGLTSADTITTIKDSEASYLFSTKSNRYLAQAVSNTDGTTTYYATDTYGNVRYDETKDVKTFYFKRLQKLQNAEVITTLPCNVYDLTRKAVKDADGNITSYDIKSMSEQPDICQALTVMAPSGATQTANRVNLYFKHQFSQVQVNLRNSNDGSVKIDASQIKKVELLGVSEKGYVFTTLDENGLVEPTTYEPVNIGNYTDEQLKKNPYGTSFEMFSMTTDRNDYPANYICSFNSLTFGVLQAIRITWEESDTQITHEATLRVSDDALRNLHSGYKYVWNIELRRGTLAIVRTQIVDWLVPDDGSLNYGADGTISN